MDIYKVPSPRGEQIELKTEDRDHLSALDVVWANKYDGETISPTTANKMEFEFYKGAPPQWLNLYWAEQQKSPIVKRGVFQDLKSKINESKGKRWSIGHINLFHNPGSGGSTLAMQVLWDLRKDLRCAKLLDSTSDTKTIAQQVLRLFQAGGSEKQNTVLLLLDNTCTSEDGSFRKTLEENLYDEIKTNNVTATIPVVIILSCLRQKHLTERRNTLNLPSQLSQEEQSNFTRKLSDIKEKHGSRHTQLYAFNIMLKNYDESYVTEICSIFHILKEKRSSRKQQLLAFLSLINSYVPGSYLPHELCQMLLEREGNNFEDFSLAQHVQPFTDLLIIFPTKEDEVRSEKTHVRMVHPMIAQECLRLLTEADVTRSDTTMNLMIDLCSGGMPFCLVKTIKTLLTKREFEPGKEKINNFSKLILDVKEENPSRCVDVLKMALNKFRTDPYFPQVLARFYYLEKRDYVRAEQYAKMAIVKDTKNSFIRDTLGQVHKNHLKNICKEELLVLDTEAYTSKILQLGRKATEAFLAEEEVARKEEAPEMQDHVMTSTSTFFNNRGIFGYMQVAKIIFEHLQTLHEEWPKILTQEITPKSFLRSYASGKFEKYKNLITSLRDEVENKFEFFEWYLLFSKPSIDSNEPSYFWPEVHNCYSDFVTQNHNNSKSALQMLKERKASTFAGLLQIQGQRTDLELITEQWEEIYLESPSDAQIIQNYIVSNVMLSQSNETSTALRPLEELQAMLHNLWTERKDQRSPEFYLLVLLLFWPDEQQGNPNCLDVSECIQYMHRSFDRTYKKYLRSRYLKPLFFHNKGHGLQKFVRESQSEPLTDRLTKGYDVPQLQRMRGEVINYSVFAGEGSEKIKVAPDHPANVHGQGKVSFYLALTINGPVAYNIRYE